MTSICISLDTETDQQILKLEEVQCFLSKRLKQREYYTKDSNGIDKLRPYGFDIHGCIEGYSRKIMWMEIVYSSKDPRIELHHYLSTIKNKWYSLS